MPTALCFDRSGHLTSLAILEALRWTDPKQMRRPAPGALSLLGRLASLTGTSLRLLPCSSADTRHVVRRACMTLPRSGKDPRPKRSSDKTAHATVIPSAVCSARPRGCPMQRGRRSATTAGGWLARCPEASVARSASGNGSATGSLPPVHGRRPVGRAKFRRWVTPAAGRGAEPGSTSALLPAKPLDRPRTGGASP